MTMSVDLRIYTTALPRGGMSQLAKELGVTPIYLSQLAARQDGRLPSPALCVLIEAKTDKAVRRWDLRPDDWHLIWPELLEVEGRPDVAEAKAA